MAVEAQAFIYNELKDIADARREYGSPSLGIPPHDVLGIPPRNDRLGTFQESLQQIFFEGKRMGGVQEIQASENESYVVFSTIAASAHTPFVVDYAEFTTEWESHLAQHPEFQPRLDGPFVLGTEEGHAKCIASQLVTWVMKKKEVQRGAIKKMELESVNVFQLNKTAQEGMDKEKIVEEVLQAVHTHTDLHEEVLTSLVSCTIGPVVCTVLGQHGISMKPDEIMKVRNVMVAGNHRGNINIDGKGGGPQSHPTFHKHTVVYPNFEKLEERAICTIFIPGFRTNDFHWINEKIHVDDAVLFNIARALIKNPSTPHDELAQLIGDHWIRTAARYMEGAGGWMAEYPNTNQHAIIEALISHATKVAGVLQAVAAVFQPDCHSVAGGGVVTREENQVMPEELFKLADPYGALFFELNKEWGTRVLSEIYKQQGVSHTIGFTGKDVPEMAFAVHPAHGWVADIQTRDVALVEKSVLIFMGKAEKLWKEGERAWKHIYLFGDDSLLTELQNEQGLTTDAIAVLKQMHPTNKQLERWIEEGYTTNGKNEDLNEKLLRRRNKQFVMKAIKDTLDGSLEERALAFGRAQILDGYYEDDGQTFILIELNKGYNIPGVASFGFMYEKTPDGYRITTLPFLSLKGWAEEAVGMGLGRMSGKV